MLAEAVTQYIALRRAVGYSMRRQEVALGKFARFAAERGDMHVRRQTAIEWALEGYSPPTKYERLRLIVQFSRFARAEDPRHEIPPIGAVPRARYQRCTPYIYSLEEVGRLIEEAARLAPAGSMRPLTYSTLFGLLAATGMRPSEALALRLDDVKPGSVIVRHSKFGESRLVLLHESTETVLDSYLARRREIAGADDHLFVSRRGKALPYSTVTSVFHGLVRKLGLRAESGRRGPRIYDLRHSFAVRALERCPRDRDRIGRHMLALSTYLGHSRISSTYWYLEATPQLLTDIADDCSAHIEGDPA